jgi:hypothetical protein
MARASASSKIQLFILEAANSTLKDEDFEPLWDSL